MKTPNQTIETIIWENGYIIQTVSGRSMYPMLRDRKDSVIIEKPSFPLKKYDVPLYKTEDGKYVLHRIIKIKDNKYVIRGDNTYTLEKNVTDQNIVGVLTAYYRGKRYYKVTNGVYKFYVRLNLFFYPLRLFYVKCKGFFGKIFRKTFKKNK